VNAVTATESHAVSTTAPHVYEAIWRVQGGLNESGIAKNRRNSQGSGYNFRGIDDCYNAVAPLMFKHGLCMLPRMVQREVQERNSKSGGVLIYTVVRAEFDFVSARDGSKHTVTTFGEAMDSGDKSTNKAMSAAQKYAILQTFVVPTEADNDTENQTHEVVADTASILERLRDASLRGSDALKAEWEASKKAPGFLDVWKRHAESLKSAAVQADAS
jgi:hypothetical protein